MIIMPDRAFATALLTITLCGGAHAQDAQAPMDPQQPWTGNVRLGYLATTGNSESENLNFGAELQYTQDRWTHALSGSAVGASDEDESTAEAYALGWRSAYDISEANYLFGRIDWLKDKFSGYDQQLSETVGYGRRVIDRTNQHLNLEIGAGARQSKLRTGESQDDAIARFGAEYEYRFNDTARFNFDLGVEAGQDNTFTEATGALRTQLFARLASVIAYTLRNNTDVPADSEKTDTITSISLEYLF